MPQFGYEVSIAVISGWRKGSGLSPQLVSLLIQTAKKTSAIWINLWINAVRVPPNIVLANNTTARSTGSQDIVLVANGVQDKCAEESYATESVDRDFYFMSR